MKILINTFKVIFWLIAFVFMSVYAVGSVIFTFFEYGAGNPAGIMVYDSFFTYYKDRYFSD